jgi:glycosyltransferase involved in cell wall biosynthesis
VRILAMTHEYLPGHCAGAETMLHGMLRALVAAGHQVDVTLSLQTGEPYEIDGIRVRPRQSKKVSLDLLLACDVVIAHLANTPPAAALGKWNGKPVVILSHNNFRANYKATLAPQGRVSLMVVNSAWMVDDLRAWIARQKPRQIGHIPAVIVHRPVVDPAEHATTPGDRVTLVNISKDFPAPDGHVTGKGGELFRALAERMPDTLFLGVTGGYGPQQDMSGLPNTEVLPHVPNAQMRDRVWARTRVLLVPSGYESWGRVASEALCSGIPVIAHPTVGLVENLAGAGIFVDRHDTDGWIAALRKLQDPDAYLTARGLALARAAEQQRMHAEDDERWIASVEALGRGGDPVAGLAHAQAAPA